MIDFRNFNSLIALTAYFNSEKVYQQAIIESRWCNGDGIIIDFTKNTIKGSRYAYNIEIDNRYKPLWDEFINELSSALNSRNI